MNRTEIGEENHYFEMESKQADDAGIYDDVEGQSTAAPVTKQTTCGEQQTDEKRKLPESTEPAHSCQANIVIDQRLLCIIISVVAVSFLTAAATFILALTMVMSRNPSTAATDCASVQGELEEIKKNISYLVTDSARMMKVSKTQGPRGPPGPSGYNGTQGPPGVAGPSGSPGPSGSCNLSLCSYKEVKSTGVSPGAYATTDTIAVETKGKKFLGVNCGTNDASVISFATRLASDGRISYKCTCKNTASSGVSTMYCYIRYWECPT